MITEARLKEICEIYEDTKEKLHLGVVDWTNVHVKAAKLIPELLLEIRELQARILHMEKGMHG